jgi:hypothetical protein
VGLPAASQAPLRSYLKAIHPRPIGATRWALRAPADPGNLPDSQPTDSSTSEAADRVSGERSRHSARRDSGCDPAARRPTSTHSYARSPCARLRSRLCATHALYLRVCRMKGKTTTHAESAPARIAASAHGWTRGVTRPQPEYLPVSAPPPRPGGARISDHNRRQPAAPLRPFAETWGR